MKKRLTRIAPFKLGLALAVSGALLGLVFALVAWAFQWPVVSSDYSYNQVPLTAVYPAPATATTSAPLSRPTTTTNGDAILAGSTVVHLAPVPPQNDFGFISISETGGLSLLLFPVLYGIMGFVCGALGAWFFNLTAKWTGGIELTVEDASYHPPRPSGS